MKMETATPAGLPPRNAPASDVTGPDIVPAGLPPRTRILSAHPMSASAVVLAALAGLGLASLIGRASDLTSRHFPKPLSPGRGRTL
jgi:hypothetical protein